MTPDHVLSSWNDGAAKSAIVDFVARVTRQGSADFVLPAERIATFDNDGTLWCEQPLQVQVFFVIDRVKELAAKDPTMKQRQRRSRRCSNTISRRSMRSASRRCLNWLSPPTRA